MLASSVEKCERREAFRAGLSPAMGTNISRDGREDELDAVVGIPGKTESETRVIQIADCVSGVCKFYSAS